MVLTVTDFQVNKVKWIIHWYNLTLATLEVYTIIRMIRCKT